MKKNLLLMSFLFSWTISLSAQITRNQADAIVLDYLKNEGIPQQVLLYVNADAPSAEGVLTTSNEEVIKAKYACWIYFLDENESQSRYLFVKADSGNLLEVIASNDSGPNDLFSWKAVDTTNGLTQVKDNSIPLFPNPVGDILTLPCNGEPLNVEICDLSGTRLFSGSLSAKDCKLDVSFLKTGVYLVNVSGKTYKIIKK